MLFVSFKLKNFKGISEEIEIDLSGGDKDFPFILMGNNESGKTTTLQGIHLISRLCLGKNLDNVCLASIRPKTAYFEDEIILSTRIELSNSDIID